MASEFYRDVVAYAWDNIWEHGNGDNAHILANNDYKVQSPTWNFLQLNV